MDMDWTSKTISAAMSIAMQRFAMNCVAGHMVSPTYVDSTARTVPHDRFDFKERLVVDTETLNLHEPFAECNVTLAQLEEFSTLTGDAATQSKVATTVTRAASGLARWHDVLFFRGLDLALLPPGVEPGKEVRNNVPTSLHEAAEIAEKELNQQPIPVKSHLNEGLVAAAFEAILELESRGYYATYHMILGQTLWEELHRPTQGSLVLPIDRIKDTLMGGMFFRTTTLPANEALLASMDGATIENVVACSDGQYPPFLLLPPKIEKHETIYHARIRGCLAPRVRETHAIVRLQAEKKV
jgi:hypothetical protein